MQNRGLVESLRLEKYAKVIADLDNVRYVEGHGRLTQNSGGLKVEVRSNREDECPFEVLPADRVLLASGVRTSLPSQLADDLAKVEYLTNETAYFESKQPESLIIIIGGGYIALEAAQMFARLGAKVTVLQRSDFVLSRLDHEISAALARYLRSEGIQIEVGVDVTSVESYGKEVLVKGTNRDRIYRPVN